MAVIDHRCTKCGKKTPAAAAFCPHCKVCLLIDVTTDRAIDDARSIYLAAKEIDELGTDAPTFNETKAALEMAPGLIAAECTRGTAQAVANVLRKHRIEPLAVPVRRPRRPIASRSGPLGRLRPWLFRAKKMVNELPANAKIILVTGLCLGGLVLVLSLGDEVEHPVSSKSLAASAGSGVSSREVVFTALRSTVQLRCSGSSGAGFFIDPEHLVTNASLLGTGNSPVEILFPDGRTKSGRVQRSDPWLDLAVVEVPGAEGVPLELGDATDLERGSTVMAIGSPVGLEFTVTQGVVSHPARLLMGMVFLQVDAAMRADSGGGPVLDRNGRVVGISSMITSKSSTLGLTIPVNYLWSETSALVERDRNDGERSRWKKIVINAARQETADLQEIRSSLASASLVSARFLPPETVQAVIVRFAPHSPAAENVNLELLDGGRQLCSIFGEISSWEPIDETADSMVRSRFNQWIARHKLPGQFYAATIHLDLYGCPGPEAVRGAELILSGGDPRANRTVITS